MRRSVWRFTEGELLSARNPTPVGGGSKLRLLLGVAA
jgi:hypothetical protein